jgi:hypothetical protein
MTMRRRTWGLFPSLCILTALGVLCGASPALAKEVHAYKSSFGGEGSGPEQLSKPAGVAVNDATGDVYVVDQGNNRVEEFNADGSALLAEFNGSAAPTGALSEPTEITVDNSTSPLDPSKEDVYVVDRGHGVIDKFDSSGTYLGQLTGTPVVKNEKGETTGGLFEPGQSKPRAIEGVAVDPSGTVWVSINTAPIYSFSDVLENEYASERETTASGGSGLAVDGEDNLYIGGRTVEKVSSSGKTLLGPTFNENEREFFSPFGGEPTGDISNTFQVGVAVDPRGDEVYIGRDSRDGVSDSEETETTVGAFSLTATPVERFGAGHIPGVNTPIIGGLAVDASTGTVYVTDRSADQVSAFDEITLPSVEVAPVSEQQPRSLTLNGIVDPEGKPVTSCVFEYATAEEYEVGKSYGHSVSCSPASVGSGTTAVPVSVHLSGLTPGETYHYRLAAENAAHVPNETSDQTLIAGPIVGDEFITDVASTSATLQAPIDPNGAATSYYVEYGVTAAYGFSAPVLAPGLDLGSAVGAQLVSVHLQGLEAGVVYHCRFVVVQDGESFAGPDRSFTTQSAGGATGLLDGRSWELVSPPDKHGALVELFESGGQVQAASDGSGITYLTKGPSAGEAPAGHIELSQELSRRGPDGWSTVDLTLPNRPLENGESESQLLEPIQEYKLFSPELSLAAVEPQLFGTPPLAAGVTERTLYVRNDASEAFLPLVSQADLPSGTKAEESSFLHNNERVVSDEFEMHFLAATPDLHHVVLATPLALTPEAIQEETVKSRGEELEKSPNVLQVQSNLYEWGEGKLQLVNILPPPAEKVAHGRLPTVPLVYLAGMLSTAGTPHGGVQRDISSDGRRIAWTWGAPTPEGLKYYRGLFVRDMVEGRTVRVGGASAAYQTMNSDGSKIFYLENGNLYVYDFETGAATTLTAAHGAGEPNGGVQELVSDVSEDGSYVYYVATGVLADGGVSGEDNLYLAHDTGSAWTTTFIATLSPADKPDWYANSFGRPVIGAVSSRVSPSGRYLAFMSDRSLTGYDNTDAVSGEADEEVYLYDAQAGKLVCASCDPTGARPVGVFDSGSSELLVDRNHVWTADEGYGPNRDNHWLAGSVPTWDNLDEQPATYQPRYLSDAGRLFFDSPDALVPHDTNGLEDVYEYEPLGEGTCERGASSATSVYSEAAGGCIGLISSGTSSSESAFYDASENGNDVFFDTTAQLTSEDNDKAYDLYDAHVCGAEGVPCRTTPVSSPPCDEGESCKAAPTPQPEIFGPAPSATFNGAGNITPTPLVTVKKTTKKKAVKCGKGFAKKKNRCVRKTKKKTKAKKSTRRAK